MKKLMVFNFISLNGFFKGPGGDVSWAHGDPDTDNYAVESMKSGGMLVFGRVTYDLMKSFWPTEMAIQNFPEIAQGMNEAEKIVFSRTLNHSEWNNARIIGGDIVDEMKKLKQYGKKDMAILGSGTIVNQFAAAGLIDEYQFMIHPVVLGEGTPLFMGLSTLPRLKLSSSRVFPSGKVLLSYQPA